MGVTTIRDLVARVLPVRRAVREGDRDRVIDDRGAGKADDAPRDPPETPEDPIDLLALIDPLRDSVGIPWKKHGQTLVSHGLVGARLQIP
jgi:hypothetical protein